MFDYIKNKLYCPYCGELSKENDYQTKSFSRSMGELDILKIRGLRYNMYHQCRSCNNWIELNIDNFHCEGIHTIEEGKKQIKERQEEIRKMFHPKRKKK